MSSKISDERLAELRAIAGAATPGPWEADGSEVSQHWSRPEPWLEIASSEVACMAYCYGGSARGIDREEDADHIAAFDPPTVLALLDELAEYRAREAESDYQWSVMSRDGFVPWSFVNRKKAEEAASAGGTLVRRLVGPWEAVSDDD